MRYTPQVLPAVCVPYSRKTTDHQFDSCVVTDGTPSCHLNNLRCHQWRQSCQTDDPFFVVVVSSVAMCGWGQSMCTFYQIYHTYSPRVHVPYCQVWLRPISWACRTNTAAGGPDKPWFTQPANGILQGSNLGPMIATGNKTLVASC